MTAIHRIVAACRAGSWAPVVAALPSGWLVLGERQVFSGYCLLLPDPVVPDLNALGGAARTRFLGDMALAGDALLEACGALRINYAMFGNVEPALHAHLFPRRSDEPAATRTAQPWALDWNLAPPFAADTHGALAAAIAASIRQRL